MKYQSQNKFFNKYKKPYNKFKTKYDDNTTQSNRLINMLQTKRMIDINTKFETKIDNFENKSNNRLLINQQRNIDHDFEKKIKNSSNINILKNEKIMTNIDKLNNFKTNKSFISSIIKQKKLESTYKYKKTIENIDERYIYFIKKN